MAVCIFFIQRVWVFSIEIWYSQLIKYKTYVQDQKNFLCKNLVLQSMLGFPKSVGYLWEMILLEHCVVPSTLLPTNLPREGSRNFQLIGLILVDLGGLCNLVFLSWHVNRRFDCKTNVSRRHHAIDKKPTNYGFLYNEQSFPTHLCV